MEPEFAAIADVAKRGDIAKVWHLMDKGIPAMNIQTAGDLYHMMRTSNTLTKTQAKFLFGIMFARLFEGDQWEKIVNVYFDKSDHIEIKKGAALYKHIRRLYE